MGGKIIEYAFVMGVPVFVRVPFAATAANGAQFYEADIPLRSLAGRE